MSVYGSLYDSAYRRLELLLKETKFIETVRICECGYDEVLKHATRAGNFYKGIEEVRDTTQKEEFTNSGQLKFKIPLAMRDGTTRESLFARVGDDRFKEI